MGGNVSGGPTTHAGKVLAASADAELPDANFLSEVSIGGRVRYCGTSDTEAFSHAAEIVISGRESFEFRDKLPSPKTWKAHEKELPPSFVSFVKDLEKTDLFQRCFGIPQTNIVYTTRRQADLGDRGMHMKDTAAFQYFYGEKLGLDKRDALIAMVAALVHDVGHPPAQHVGERVAQRILGDPEALKIDRANLGNWKSFDHDIHGLSLIESVEFNEVLRSHSLFAEHNIEPMDIVCALAERPEHLMPASEQGEMSKLDLGMRLELFQRYRHIEYMVREISDRVSYLPLDTRARDFDLKKFTAVDFLQNQVLERTHLGYRVEGNGKLLGVGFDQQGIEYWENGRFRIGPAPRLPLLRTDMFGDVGMHPETESVNAVLERGTIRAFQNGLTFDEFIRMTNDELLSSKKFPEHYREWLQKGVGNAFCELISIPFTAFSEAGLRAVGGGLKYELAKRLEEAGLPRDSAFVCEIQDGSKRMPLYLYTDDPNGKFGKGRISGKVRYLGDIGTIDSEEHRAQRYFYVIADRSLPAHIRDEAQSKIKSMLESCTAEVDGTTYPILKERTIRQPINDIMRQRQIRLDGQFVGEN
jgi:hypothetical protein